MIDLLALDRYQETYIAHLHPNDPTRKWWDGLSFREQLAISSGQQLDLDAKADVQFAENNA